MRCEACSAVGWSCCTALSFSQFRVPISRQRLRRRHSEFAESRYSRMVCGGSIGVPRDPSVRRRSRDSSADRRELDGLGADQRLQSDVESAWRRASWLAGPIRTHFIRRYRRVSASATPSTPYHIYRQLIEPRPRQPVQHPVRHYTLPRTRNDFLRWTVYPNSTIQRLLHRQSAVVITHDERVSIQNTLPHYHYYFRQRK